LLRGLFLTLKMEAICSSETSVEFQRTTRRYIPEDRNEKYIQHFRTTDCTLLNLTFIWGRDKNK
jgi:hypothetical protein